MELGTHVRPCRGFQASAGVQAEAAAPMGVEELPTCVPCHGVMRWLLGHDVQQARLLSGACASFCGVIALLPLWCLGRITETCHGW